MVEKKKKKKKVSEKKKILVIVESPAKAKTINRYLGRNYIVDSSNGHLVDLPKSRMAIDIENDFEPEYKVVRGRMSIVKELKKKAKKAEKILLAADPDREGEAISWHLANIFKEVNPNIKRIVFNEITKEAIKESLNHIHDIDMDKVNAQQARRVLDRLVGYNISPILWKKVKAGLSAGRVQSVALRLICEREKEVKAFKSEEYWSIDVEFISKKNIFSAKLKKINGEDIAINNKEEADRISSLLRDADYKISDVKVKERKKNPLSPYITSKLQQDSLNRLGYSAQKTMFIAQQLYQGIEIKGEGMVGLITYMRTDSTRIAESALATVRSYIKEHFNEEYIPEKPNVYKNKKNAQDAHEAIRPTDISRAPGDIVDSLPQEQYKLYELIYNRFLASQMTPGILLQTSVIIIGRNKDENFELRLSFSKYKFDGFTKVYSYNNNDQINDLPDFSCKDILNYKDFISEQHFTQPPPRYNDASLVKILEESGIGRPSTYAPTIATIQYRYYVDKDGRQLVPTELGLVVNNLLQENFPEIFNVNFTAEVEEKLDEVAEAKVEWKEIIRDFYPSFIEKVNKAIENIEEIEDFKKGIPTGDICDKPGCEQPMVKKLGRFGYFLACSGFPDCRNAKPLPIGECPVPGCDGNIIALRSKKKRKFFACSNRDCDYVIWSKPLDEKCTVCGYYLIYSKKNRNMIKKCSNKECDYQDSEKERIANA